jgi:hypothetical protein
VLPKCLEKLEKAFITKKHPKPAQIIFAHEQVISNQKIQGIAREISLSLAAPHLLPKFNQNPHAFYAFGH